MNAKVAYQTADYKSGMVELQFEWPDWMNDPLEEAAPAQMILVLKENVYSEIEPEQAVTQVVVLDGDVKEWLQNNHTDPFSTK